MNHGGGKVSPVTGSNCALCLLAMAWDLENSMNSNTAFPNGSVSVVPIWKTTISPKGRFSFSRKGKIELSFPVPSFLTTLPPFNQTLTSKNCKVARSTFSFTIIDRIQWEPTFAIDDCDDRSEDEDRWVHCQCHSIFPLQNQIENSPKTNQNWPAKLKEKKKKS